MSTAIAEQIFNKLEGNYRIKRIVYQRRDEECMSMTKQSQEAYFTRLLRAQEFSRNDDAGQTAYKSSLAMTTICCNSIILATGEGNACFLKIEKNILLYREDLLINYHNSATRIPAFKEYKYIFKDNKIKKYFVNDERLFYKINFTSTLTAQAEHKCDHDVYNANYIFLDKNCFLLSYEICGPNKRHFIITNFTRFEIQV